MKINQQPFFTYTLPLTRLRILKDVLNGVGIATVEIATESAKYFAAFEAQ